MSVLLRLFGVMLPAASVFRKLILITLLLGSHSAIADESIVLQSTTSTANSGLYDYLLPLFQKNTGITVKVVAVGTGQAIKNAENCDGDVLLVHATQSELNFVAEGYGVERFDLMFNDFIIVGPATDPANIKELTDVVPALQRIAGVNALFASRGDDSGTHKKETALWHSAGVPIKEASGKWYRETGSGMGATLNIAVGMNAYALTDRASWISFGNKGNFEILLEGDDALYNQYGVIGVSASACPNINEHDGQLFVDWLLSPEGQAAIASYRVDSQQLFFPNASSN